MRALICKELREHVKLAVIGLVIAVLGLLGMYSLYAATVKIVATGRWDAAGYQMLQPLLSEVFLLGAGCFCAVLGAVLGWLQVHNERHRDLWAFLVHRPMSRTDIFLGKSIAGLGLYVCVAGGPVLVFVLCLRFLGGLLAPFEWAMVLPVAAYFLAGVVYYFAGMLTALRQARWYASRGLPLLVALLVSAQIADAAHFWQALLLIGVAAGLLAIACWGGFQGADTGQPALGKLGLTGSLAGGGYVLGAAIAAVLLNAAVFSGGLSWSAYTVTKDGRIYKSIRQSRGVPEIVDLEGKPLKDPKTGQKIDLREFNRLTSSVISIRPDFEPNPQWHDRFQQPSHYFFGWRVTPDTAWYYWRKYGRLVAFDLASRRVVGSLGPDGFVAGMPGKNSPRFEPALGMGYNLNSREQVLCTERAVYRVNAADQTCTAIFTTTAEEPIGGMQTFSVNGSDWTQTLVVTKHFISLLARDGTPLWKMPYDPPYPEYTMVQVHVLEPAGQFALWMIPSEKANARAGWNLPIQVRWLAEGQGAVKKSAELPVLGERTGYDWKMKLVNVFRPPIAPSPNAAADRAGIIDWESVLVALAAAGLIYVPIAWWLSRRYALPIWSAVGWSCFILAAGFPAFVAFLAVHDWPARERCPACRRLRVVNRKHCEHCEAEFAVPERIGTEIFEPVG